METGGNGSPFDLDRLRSHPWLADVVYHDRIESTNDTALRLASAHARVPLLVLARSQSAGRGRGDHRWWSSDGALTFSIAIDAASLDIPPDRLPLVSLATGLALARSLENGASGPSYRLKWPNDVYINERKAGGVLIETAPSRPPRLVIGIGLNVNNTMRDAPPEIAPRAISLTDVVGTTVPLTDLLVDVIEGLRREYAAIAVRPAESLAAWRDRCLLTGRDVELVVGGRAVQGVCRGIDERGAIRIATASGEVTLVTGEVRRASGILE
ncbi:MAG: biotin--[acetyl-CoA-carboxylase] ligase [Planctomycetes bacterium]|nr:biotin--[acetyl-CoA-carboxylase] ligase [Planctomycetota bacterium]